MANAHIENLMSLVQNVESWESYESLVGSIREHYPQHNKLIDTLMLPQDAFFYYIRIDREVYKWLNIVIKESQFMN